MTYRAPPWLTQMERDLLCVILKANTNMGVASMKIKERVAELHNLLAHHANQYYTLDAPEISDSAYDSLYRELCDLEEKYPELARADSVTKQIVGEALPSLKKVKHTVPQWSFNDAFSQVEVRAFDERVRKVSGSAPTYDLELKIDGLKIVFTYGKGRLMCAATRGDGKVGEDVTHNIRTIAEVPERLLRPIDLIVEGEVYLTRSGFLKLNATRQAIIRESAQRRRGLYPPIRPKDSG